MNRVKFVLCDLPARRILDPTYNQSYQAAARFIVFLERNGPAGVHSYNLQPYKHIPVRGSRIAYLPQTDHVVAFSPAPPSFVLRFTQSTALDTNAILLRCGGVGQRHQ